MKKGIFVPPVMINLLSCLKYNENLKLILMINSIHFIRLRYQYFRRRAILQHRITSFFVPAVGPVPVVIKNDAKYSEECEIILKPPTII